MNDLSGVWRTADGRTAHIERRGMCYWRGDVNGVTMYWNDEGKQFLDDGLHLAERMA